MLVTGHSLGGALAQLCSFDIARACPCLGCMAIACYTFGSPRVGYVCASPSKTLSHPKPFPNPQTFFNPSIHLPPPHHSNHAFARAYNRLVPDTFSVINDQDIIVHSGKFVSYYKRPAWRVILHPAGDMVVRPSYMEVTLHRMVGGGAKGLTNHQLKDYQRALMAVHNTQLAGRGYPDGALAMQTLGETQPALMRALKSIERRNSSSDRRRSGDSRRQSGDAKWRDSEESGKGLDGGGPELVVEMHGRGKEDGSVTSSKLTSSKPTAA